MNRRDFLKTAAKGLLAAMAGTMAPQLTGPETCEALTKRVYSGLHGWPNVYADGGSFKADGLLALQEMLRRVHARQA